MCLKLLVILTIISSFLFGVGHISLLCRENFNAKAQIIFDPTCARLSGRSGCVAKVSWGFRCVPRCARFFRVLGCEEWVLSEESDVDCGAKNVGCLPFLRDIEIQNWFARQQRTHSYVLAIWSMIFSLTKRYYRLICAIFFFPLFYRELKKTWSVRRDSETFVRSLERQCEQLRWSRRMFEHKSTDAFNQGTSLRCPASAINHQCDVNSLHCFFASAGTVLWHDEIKAERRKCYYIQVVTP